MTRRSTLSEQSPFTGLKTDSRRLGCLKLLLLIICMPAFILASLIELDSISEAGSARARGLSFVDLHLFSHTLHSHRLLPDALLAIDINNLERQKEDFRNIQKLFPDQDEQRRVLDWGKDLVASCTMKHLPAHFLFANFAVQPGVDLHRRLLNLEVTDRLAAHAAWRRITAARGVQEAELFKLEELFKGTITKKEERDSLLRWATQRLTQKEVVQNFIYPPTRFTVRPSPPDLEWFRLWTLYEDWCFTDRMFDAKKKFLMDQLGNSERKNSTWKALLEFGDEVAKQRSGGKDDDFLPSSGERTAITAAIDRIAGIEPVFSAKHRSAARQFVGQQVLLGSYSRGPRQPESFLLDTSFRSHPIYGNETLAALGAGKFSASELLPFVPYALEKDGADRKDLPHLDPADHLEQAVALQDSYPFCSHG